MMSRRNSVLQLFSRITRRNASQKKACTTGTSILETTNRQNAATFIPIAHTAIRCFTSTNLVSEDHFQKWHEDNFSPRGNQRHQKNEWDEYDDMKHNDTEHSVQNLNDLNYDSRQHYKRKRGRFSNEFGNDRQGYRQTDGNRFRSRTSDSWMDASSRVTMEELFGQVNNKKVDFSGNAPIRKNVLEVHPDVIARSEEDVKAFLDTHQMTITGSNTEKPIFKFDETGFSDEILKKLEKLNYEQPTPIQSIGWPHALAGHNVVGIAQTGSGKTLSFMLPAILHIQAQKEAAKGRGPIALVLCPTRELAMQCHEVVKPFDRLCRIRSTVVYGGASKYVQSQRASHPKLDLLIATPGRLLDFITTGDISLERCSYLVLDEADRMLDMGFEPQIRSVLGQIRPDRQVLMWSATWPEEIQDLAMDFLEDYTHLKIGSQIHTVNSDVKHEFQLCTRYEKDNFLLEHLRENRNPKDPKKPAKTLIFSKTKVGCSRIELMLRKEGIHTGSLHGGLSQLQRDNTMTRFRRNIYPVIIASDLAARGLDVSDIEYVINYDLPENIDDYIHRVGRTARAGKHGTAISYITIDDIKMIQPIMRLLEDAGHEVPENLHRLESARLNMRTKSGPTRSTRRNFYKSNY